MREIIESAIERKILKKMALSKPADKAVLKTVCSLFIKYGVLYAQFETFMRGGKVSHKNMESSEVSDYTLREFESNYGQLDIVTSAGSCQALKNNKGKLHIVNNIKIGSDTPPAAGAPPHDREKKRFLTGAEPFLIELGISGGDGRVYDRKQAKFRQINRFLEIIDDIYEKLPGSGELTVYDLCCGKSYLTFAAYYYFTVIKRREIFMRGTDLKNDVIEYCSAAAIKLDYSSLSFRAGDIETFVPERKPDMMISLHACDTATDMVLAAGVKTGAEVILSTPCCQHELFSQIRCDHLGFITEHGIFKQKLSDIVTDALRCKRLEIEGYKVSAAELTDPDETPKNVMIRAVKLKSKLPPEKIRKLKEEYDKACGFFNVSPYLGKLL